MVAQTATGSRIGIGVGVGFGGAVGTTVGVGTGVGAAVGDGEGVGDGVAAAVGEGVGVGTGVGVTTGTTAALVGVGLAVAPEPQAPQTAAAAKTTAHRRLIADTRPFILL